MVFRRGLKLKIYIELTTIFLLKYKLDIVLTKICYEVDFKVSIHVAVGRTESEILVGMAFKFLLPSLSPKSIHMH